MYSSQLIDKEGSNWEYLPYGPFKSKITYLEWLKKIENKNDPVFFVVIRKLDKNIESKTLEIFNKVDLLNKDEYKNMNKRNAILVSAKNGIGIDQIKFAINNVLNHTYLSKNLTFNRDYGQISNWLYENCKVISKKINGLNSHHYHVNISKINLAKLKNKYPFVKILS